MKITVIQKANPKKSPNFNCPWMIDYYEPAKK